MVFGALVVRPRRRASPLRRHRGEAAKAVNARARLHVGSLADRRQEALASLVRRPAPAAGRPWPVASRRLPARASLPASAPPRVPAAARLDGPQRAVNRVRESTLDFRRVARPIDEGSTRTLDKPIAGVTRAGHHQIGRVKRCQEKAVVGRKSASGSVPRPRRSPPDAGCCGRHFCSVASRSHSRKATSSSGWITPDGGNGAAEFVASAGVARQSMISPALGLGLGVIES